MKSTLFLILIFTLSAIESKVISIDMDQIVQLNHNAGIAQASIQVLLAKLRSKHESIEKANEPFYEHIISNCYKMTNISEGFITSLKNQIRVNELNKIKAASDIEHSLEEQKQYSADFTKSKEEYDLLNDQMHKMMEGMKTKFIEANQKIDVIKTLKDIIHDELLNVEQQQQQQLNQTSNQAQRNSFVQLPTFKSKLIQLQSMHSNPLISSLISIASKEDLSDQETLNTVIQLLEKLEENLNEFKHKIATDGKEAIESVKIQTQEKQKQLRTLANLILQTKSKIKESVELQDQSDLQITFIKSTIERKQIELNLFNELCSHQELKKEENKAFYENLTKMNNEASKETMQ